MNITTIKNIISNTIEVRNMLSDANRIKLTAKDSLAPRLERSAEIYDNKLTSQLSKEFINQLKRQNRDIDERKFFAQLMEAINVIGREAEVLEDVLSSGVYHSVIMREALTIKDAQMIDLMGVMDFFMSSTATVALMIAEAESVQAKGETLDPASANYYVKNILDSGFIYSYATVWGFFYKNREVKIVEKLGDLPDVRVDENVIKTIESTEGRKKVDPVGLNPINILFPTTWIYAGGKIWSELKLHRLKKLEEELDNLEARHQEILLERDGRNNPQLEKKIERYMDAIQILRVKVKRLKDRLG